MTLALFLELLVKSSLIAGAGLVLSWALSFRPAQDRVDVLGAAAVLVAVLPLLVAIAPRLPLALLAPAEPTAVSIVNAWSVDLAPIAPVAVSGAAPISWPVTMIASMLYLVVALALSGRFLIGIWTLHRWTRSGRSVSAGIWAETLARLDPKGARLVTSPRVQGPLSWGLPPGVVLIGDDCLSRQDQAGAVLAHELAHIRRRDWVFLIVSRLAVALFWFNPLVWRLHQELAERTEDAADAAAIADIEPRAYARALLDFASDAACPASLAMGGDYRALNKRIARIMSEKKPLPSRPLALGLGVVALIAVATPLAAVELTRRAAPVALQNAATETPGPSNAPRDVRSITVETTDDAARTRTVTINGRRVVWEDLTPEQRREVEADIAGAETAAIEAQRDAEQAAIDAGIAARDAEQAGIDAEAMARDAEIAARDAAAAAQEIAAVAAVRAEQEAERAADRAAAVADQRRAEARQRRTSIRPVECRGACAHRARLMGDAERASRGDGLSQDAVSQRVLDAQANADVLAQQHAQRHARGQPR